MFFFQRKSIASLVSFSLVILVIVSLFTLSYFFIDYNKNVYNKNKLSIELNRAIFDFRENLIYLATVNNSNLTYSNKLISKNIKFDLYEKQVFAKIFDDNYFFQTNETLLVPFCSNYTIYPKFETKLYFNGSCISVYS